MPGGDDLENVMICLSRWFFAALAALVGGSAMAQDVWPPPPPPGYYQRAPQYYPPQPYYPQPYYPQQGIDVPAQPQPYYAPQPGYPYQQAPRRQSRYQQAQVCETPYGTCELPGPMFVGKGCRCTVGGVGRVNGTAVAE